MMSLQAPVQDPVRGGGQHSPARLEEVLRAGGFAVTAEIAPPDSADPEEVIRRAAVFDGWVDGLNATDGPGAHAHMSSIGVSALLVRAGYSPVMQMACRDRNRIAMQGDILGAAALGIGAVLCLTGDGVEIGDHPEAKPVFDLGSITLLGAIRRMRDEKRFLSGRALTAGPNMFLGATENPFAPPHDLRPLRMRQKIEAGAQFIQTQYCFDIPLFERFMARVRDLGLHEKAFILAGVGPLASARVARWISAHVPGAHIPDEHIRRLEQAANPAAEGRRLCVELMQRIRGIAGVSGIHVIAPRQEKYVGDMVAASGVLGARRPARVAQGNPGVLSPPSGGGLYP